MKNNLKDDLQSYLDKTFPFSKIEEEHSIGGSVNIKFELGGDLENGTIERVNQASERALNLFTDSFSNPNNELWILIYEYPGKNVFNASNKYLHEQFPLEKFNLFYNKVAIIKTGCSNDKGLQELGKIKIIIGKLKQADINIQNILQGIANLEMDFEPGIDQRIFFFDQITDIGFHMYDDRGCDIFSNNANKIKYLYISRNDWIVDYHRKEIDNYFKS